MSVSCVSVFPRLQSLLWVPDQSVPPWCSSDPSWCSPVPSWYSPVLSWCLSDPLWCSPAPLWWSSVWLWWSSSLPWWSSVLLWWSSAPPWWYSVLLWWSSAPLWGSSDLSALLWWSSAPPILPAPSWSPVLPVLPQSQGLTPLHGPGPPSLPLFRLRSTALLDCVMFRTSGSHSLGDSSVMNPVHGLPSACHQKSLFGYIDSHTTQTVTCHSGLQFPSSIALITHSHLLLIRHAL